MRLSFTRAGRKMRACYEVSELENGAYFYEDGFIVGKLIDNEFLQLVVQDGEEVKLLVLARNMKRKCGQELTVADMIFVDLFDDNKLVKCVKRRQFIYTVYAEVEAHGVKPIGFVHCKADGIEVKIPKLAVDEELSGLETFDGRRVFIVNSRTKPIKQSV